jgi:hypothetical protein
MKKLIFMGLFGNIMNLFAQDGLPLSGKLDKINYFDLVTDPSKLNKMKFEIDKNSKPGTYYNSNIWLTFPNDYYLSSVYQLTENKNESSTSDFRAFEVWAGDLYEQNAPSYLNSAKAVFEKNGLKLNWADEKIECKKESDKVEYINHTLTINGVIYLLYSGNARDRSRVPAFDYLTNFRKMLNKVIAKQNSKLKVIVLTAPESVYFVLCDDLILKGLKSIIKETENKIEE